MRDNETKRMPDPTGRASNRSRAVWVVPIVVILFVLGGLLFSFLVGGGPKSNTSTGTASGSAGAAAPANPSGTSGR
jgi:hypothetical protein